jgi:large-conductance mechanosensitive channel
MSNSNETSSADLNNIKTGWALAILVGIGLVIVGFYFFNFNSHILKNEGWWKVFQNLSADTGNWGTFGDYVGGILNPVIAAFAFYLIAKTFELQKRELKQSTDALNDQVKLAALTALLNSNLTKISMLESEKISLLQGIVPKPKDPVNYLQSDIYRARQMFEQITGEGTPEGKIKARFEMIELEISDLTENKNKLEEQIETFLKKN